MTINTAVPHLERASELLWQTGHPAIAEALEGEVAQLLAALKEEMAWDMGGVPENELMRRAGLAQAVIDRLVEFLDLDYGYLPHEVKEGPLTEVQKALDAYLDEMKPSGGPAE